MTKNSAPSDLAGLRKKVYSAAIDFGYKQDVNAKFRDCVSYNGKINDPPKDDDKKVIDSNYWFGFIREDQENSGPFEGLSFVIFPEHDNKRCLVAIGIGSSSIGMDGELAASQGFRRSFIRLNKRGDSNAKFFYKLRFDDMSTSTPGLQDELNNPNMKYGQELINTVTKYNADEKKEAPGLLPAAFIVDYTTNDGWKLIKAWLAQYARWRMWDRYKNGNVTKGANDKIKAAIDAGRMAPYCPQPNEVYKILLDRKYVILQGAPGCGKTWSANEVAKIFNKGNKDNVIFTQFHAETTYSDFVYGIRPVLNGKSVAYKGKKGVLLEAIDKANATEDDVLLIIDEINRANLANVLGPVFYLFEPNADRDFQLNLGTVTNDKGDEELIYKELPKNLYVLATMNTADKSLAIVDFALRRRFSWITLRPHIVNTDNFDVELFNSVDNLFIKYATDEELNLQPGQSYFMDKRKRRKNIIYGLMPLMKEYFNEGFMLSAKEDFEQLFFKETHLSTKKTGESTEEPDGVFMYE